MYFLSSSLGRLFTSVLQLSGYLFLFYCSVCVCVWVCVWVCVCVCVCERERERERERAQPTDSPTDLLSGWLKLVREIETNQERLTYRVNERDRQSWIQVSPPPSLSPNPPFVLTSPHCVCDRPPGQQNQHQTGVNLYLILCSHLLYHSGKWSHCVHCRWDGYKCRDHSLKLGATGLTYMLCKWSEL